MAEQDPVLAAWHAMVQSRDPALLDALLADDAEFRSPAVFTPQRGKAAVTLYLTGAITVLGPSLRYVGQWQDHSSAVLEFEAELDGRYVQGVDLLRWNDDGKLTSITVLVRPLRGLEKLVELMAGLVAGNEAGRSALTSR
jgi:SnoaL-like domain